MKNYKVLVLTDHSGHSDQNSVYQIVRQMTRHPRVESVNIASRGINENNAFFALQENGQLFTKRVDESFSYSPTGESYYPINQVNPDEYDLIFLRLPRPISDIFLITLEDIFKNAAIINNPSGIIETSSKEFLLQVSEWCPPLKLCSSIDDVMAMLERFPIVLKPLRDYGGRGLLKIKNGVVDDGNDIHDVDEYLESIKDQIEAEGYIAMKYLENVTQGDKRVLVVDGEIMAASLRLPAPDSWLCNVAQGGTSIPSEADADEIQLIEGITPILRSKGIFIYGVDTLVDDTEKRVLSEINTLSIGGFPQAEQQTGRPIINSMIDKMINYCDERS